MGQRLVSVEVQPDPWLSTTGIKPDLHEYWDDPDIDIMGGHAYDTNPASLSAKLHAAQTKNKILHDNEGNDLRSDTSKATREAWGWAMAGGYYSFFTRDRDFNKVGDATWLSVVRVATTLRDVFESVRFQDLSPIDSSGKEVDNLASQAPGASGSQVLANPGQPSCTLVQPHREGPEDHAPRRQLRLRVAHSSAMNGEHVQDDGKDHPASSCAAEPTARRMDSWPSRRVQPHEAERRRQAPRDRTLTPRKSCRG
jgi:hypothetical protein